MGFLVIRVFISEWYLTFLLTACWFVKKALFRITEKLKLVWEKKKVLQKCLKGLIEKVLDNKNKKHWNSVFFRLKSFTFARFELMSYFDSMNVFQTVVMWAVHVSVVLRLLEGGRPCV